MTQEQSLKDIIDAEEAAQAGDARPAGLADDRDAALSSRIDRLLAGSSASADWSQPGVSRYRGTILAIDIRQQTSPTTKEPLHWADGSPREILLVTLQCKPGCDRDWREKAIDPDDDDGRRALWLYWNSLNAVIAAMRKAGRSRPQTGDTVELFHHRLGKRTDAGKNPPRLYEAVYEAAA